MKVLLDENMPHEFKQNLEQAGHECLTAQDCGWSGKKNGELLKLAEVQFSVFITLDTNLEYQQNLRGYRLGVIVIHRRSQRIADLIAQSGACIESIKSMNPGQVVHVGVAKNFDG